MPASGVFVRAIGESGKLYQTHVVMFGPAQAWLLMKCHGIEKASAELEIRMSFGLRPKFLTILVSDFGFWIFKRMTFLSMKVEIYALV